LVTLSFFFCFADFAPKHDAHKPTADFLTFGVESVGNGPGSTN
jgi:hypothetical protein